ncbi:hypothetical protein KDK_74400 [Dictyobacter kobayashii]|uniref:Uncharacterized protein n=1 Tax=Dictyobacter kobayashii TaxID=2014872 RepID=A0A402AWW3_9CHLR|nr:hypothetical protein KDK_74400 [Dictyobacter kobayashii]
MKPASPDPTPSIMLLASNTSNAACLRTDMNEISNITYFGSLIMLIIIYILFKLNYLNIHYYSII